MDPKLYPKGFLFWLSSCVFLHLSLLCFQTCYAMTAFEKYYDEDAMEFLFNKLASCLNRIETDDAEMCRDALFLHNVKQKFIDRTSIPEEVAEVPEIDVVPGQYDKLFLNYMIHKKPFKVDSEATIGIYQNFTSLCSYGRRFSHIDSTSFQAYESSLEQCPLSEVILKDLRLPKPIGNCYLKQLNLTFDDMNTRRKSLDTFNYAQWPTVTVLDGSEPLAVQQCPRNMHMILWGSTSALRIRIFHSSSSHYFDPSLKNVGGIPIMHFSGTGFPKLELKSAGEKKDLKSFPRFSEISLDKAKGYIFIPYDYLVGVASQVDGLSLDDTQQHPSLFRYCFVDASNYNAFREELLQTSRWSDLDKELLLMLHNSSFEKTMKRDLEEFNLGSSYAEASTQESGNSVDDAATGAAPLTKPNKRVRGGSSSSSTGTSGGSSSFREWQETTKWNRIITSLTLPRPFTPSILAIGRKNVSISWMSPFLPAKLDSTTFGFNITLCDALKTPQGNFAKKLENSDSVCSSVAVHRPHNSLLEEVDVEESARQGFEVVRFAFSLAAGLSPSTRYRLKISLFYGDSESSSSDWTETFLTQDITAPSAIPLPRIVCEAGLKKKKLCKQEETLIALPLEDPNSAKLVFQAPEDDGGDLITGYDVYRRCSSRRYCSTAWRLIGTFESSSDKDHKGFQSIMLHDLLPDIGYIFSLTSHNSYGVSPISHPSSEFVLTFTNVSIRKESFCLYGSGTDYYEKYRPRNSTQSFASSFTVTLDDILQTVTFIDEKKTFVSLSGWSSHRSPKLFSVQSDLVLADPPMANVEETHLRNADDFFGKIVVVRRGAVPIAQKLRLAQYYGALGCIVVDDGRCDDYSQRCLPGSDKSRGEGWGRHDLPEPWENISLPTLFLLAKEAEPMLTGLTHDVRRTGIAEEL